MRPYQYKPLLHPSKEIRLINLLPGKFNDPIRVTIRHAAFVPPIIGDLAKSNRISLSELQRTLPPKWYAYETVEGRYIFYGPKVTTWTHPNPDFDPRLLVDSGKKAIFQPEYEALSYVWGSIEVTETIYIHPNENDDEKTEVQTLKIGTNLAAAMQHLRLRDQPRTIWADAMAINQRDENERSEQVKIMGHIYRHARRVVVWLGSEADNSDITISPLEYFSHQVEFTKDDWYFRSPDATEKDSWNPKVPLPWDQEKHAAVRALVQRPWFGRLWTVPEIQLANNLAVVQCGSRHMSWSLFRRALFVAAQKVNLDPDFGAQLSSINSSVVNRNVPVAFVLCNVSRRRECSEPRDKLYAILGLIGPIFAGKIKPQYSISIPKIYRNFFTTHMEVSQRLDLLPFVTMRDESQLHHAEPSWIPDWNSRETSYLETLFYHFAAAASKAHVRYLQDSVLEVVGISTTTINNLSEILTPRAEEIIRDMGIHKISADAKYVTGISLIDAYIRTLGRDNCQEKFPDDLSVAAIDEAREEVLSMLHDFGNNHKDVDIFHTILHSSRWNMMRFVTTLDGYMGYVPSNAERDDVISILLGCYKPMVLRPTSDGNYKVVGPCFILGLMEGEALLGPIPSPWIVQYYAVFDRKFFNPETEETTAEDPRLGPLPPEWEAFEVTRTKDEPIHYAYFRNKESGEVMDSDPRLLPEALEKRGVKLERICLV